MENIMLIEPYKWGLHREYNSEFYWVDDFEIHTSIPHNFSNIFNEILNKKNKVVVITEYGDAGFNYSNDGKQLILGGTNYNFGTLNIEEIPKNIYKWYSTNSNVRKELIHYLPYGCWKDRILNNIEKDILCFANFDPKTNPQRYEIKNFCESQKFIFSVFPNRNGLSKEEDNVIHKSFTEDLSRSMYCISPPGNGLDCYRTWEALYNKSIPILLNNHFSSQIKDLPVLIVDNYRDVTENLLKVRYDELYLRFDALEILDKNYWFKKIKEDKECC